MPLHLNPLSKTDDSDQYLIPAVADTHMRASLSNALFKTIFYGPDSAFPTYVDTNIGRHTHDLYKVPTSRYVVALHSDVPEVGEPWKVVSYIKYSIYASREDIAATKAVQWERKWSEYTNKSLVTEFWAEIKGYRERMEEELGPHVLVELLMTHPDFHGQGAGKMLMEVAVAEADRLGLPAVLEASPQGLKLYKSVGFEEVDSTYWVDLERFKDGGDKGKDWRSESQPVKSVENGWYPQYFMKRPARKL